MLKYSQAVSDILRKKPDCFRRFKQRAVFSCGRGFNRAGDFFKILENRGFVSANLCWGSCKRGCTQNLVFIGDEQSVVAMLSEIKAPIAHPTPASVVAKMIAARLGRLSFIIEAENDESRNDDPSPPAISKFQLSDLEDRFSNFSIRNDLANRYNGAAIRIRIDRVNSIINQKEASPETIRKAWELFTVVDVMEG